MAEPAREIARRLALLRRELSLRKLPAFVTASPVSLRYLGGTGDIRWMAVTTRRAAFMPARLSEQAVREALRGAAEVMRPEAGWAPLVRLLSRDGIHRFGIEDEGIGIADFRGVRSAARAVALAVTTPRLVRSLRAVKGARELAMIRKAAEITRRAGEMLPVILAPGVTERAAAARLDSAMRLMGADGPAFDTIVLGGPATAKPHGVPSERRFRRGDFILVDFGARVGGYHSDCTRTFACLKASPEQRRAYGAVRRAYEAGRRAVRPGRTGGDAFRAACRALGPWERRFIHGLGHGVGLEIHEAPNLVRGGGESFAAGQVVTVEPGVYVPGWGGIRLEDSFEVVRGGARSLTGAPARELPVLGTGQRGKA